MKEVYLKQLQNASRLILVLLLVACEKWPHEVDCFCLIDVAILPTSDKQLCDERGGNIIQCNIHDLIKYNEQRND